MNRINRFAESFFQRLPLHISSKERLKALFWRSTSCAKQGMDRKARLLSHISPTEQDGLEIGPLSYPTVTKDESNSRIRYVDFATAEMLREKYRDDPNVCVGDIVETDYLWGKSSLPELVNGQQFDYVIASHVIEHVPDMLGWMREIADVLKDNGILSLAIPDKRYTFDVLRELTSPGTLVEAYLLKKRRPGPREIFDHVSLAAKVDAKAAWRKRLDKRKLEHHGTIVTALEHAQANLSTEDYCDVHVNIFTSASFIDLLETASRLGLFDFLIEDFFDTAFDTVEFLVSLKRLPRNEGQEQRLEKQISSLTWARNQLLKA